jgi:plasmid stabilization system protein ParE
MVGKKLKVSVDNAAKRQLKSIYNYIYKDSPQNADKVRDDIFVIALSLPANPHKFPLDKNKINNNGSYRAFEKHHYRVVYRMLETEIRILTIRHTSMEPLEY